MPEKHYVTIKAAVWKGDKLLLQKEERKAGMVYDLPGGRIEPGEDIHEGLKREVKEEIGVEVASISGLPVKVWSAIGGTNGVVALLYEATLVSEDFKYDLSDTQEVEKADFYTIEEFEPTPDFVHKKFILEYFKEKLNK